MLSIKSLRPIVLASIILSVVTVSSSKAQFAGGTGTVGDPYQITTADHLNSIRNNMTSNFILMNNIDLDGTSYSEANGGWSRIGWSGNPYSGIFDGNDKSINGIFMESGDSGGMFAELTGTIKDLTLTNINISALSKVGGLVAENKGVIQNVIVSGEIRGHQSVGGVAGVSSENASISNSGANIIILPKLNAFETDYLDGNFKGGLVGDNDGIISNSYSTGSVTEGDGGTETGGLVGNAALASSAYITNSYSTATVTGGNYVGGLVGRLSGSGSSNLNNSYATGSVSGGIYIGGLIGDSSLDISDSYATGSVVAGQEAGGLVGYLSYSTITGSYATGNVSVSVNQGGGLVGATQQADISTSWASGNITGGSQVGGLIGRNYYYGTVWNSKATGTVSGTDAVGGFIGEHSTGGTINKNYSVGNVDGDNNVGGFIGLVSSEQNDITNSYASGSATGTDAVGGFIGKMNSGSNTVSKNYSIGSVSGSTNTGGFIGSDAFTNTISSNYWNTTTSGENSSAGGTGLTESEFTSSSSFTGFNFSLVWNSVQSPEVSYPYLKSNTQDPLPGYKFSSGGDGSLGNPFEIGTYSQLEGIENYLTSHFILINTIDASASTSANGGLGFDPIGSENDLFSGSIDGNGYTIQNLSINRPTEDYVGFIASLTGSVSDLHFVNVDITGKDYVGALAGISKSSSTIEGVSTQGNVVGERHTGGLAGRLYNGSNITNSNSQGTVESNNIYTGGLVGSNHGGNITGSYSKANVTSTGWYTGGLVGINEPLSSSGGTVSKSYTTGNVTGQGHVGGLIGRNYNGALVQRSYTTGNVVAGNLYSGGLIGSNHGGYLSDSYSTSFVDSESNHVGGLIGINEPLSFSGGEILKSYFAGSVEGTSNVGVLVGSNTGTVSNLFYGSQISGVESDAMGTELSNSQMISPDNFTDFNFDTIWDIYEGYGFPFLQDVGTYRMQKIDLTGTEGWRIMSSPMDGMSYDSLLKDLWTQGFTGADSESGTSNVYSWDESTQQFVSVSNASDIPQVGQGFMVYVYDDQDYDGTPDNFPKTLMIEGGMLNENATPTLSYNDTGDGTNDGWNLVGNPYPYPINWAAGSGWTKTNVDASFYIWNAADGEYQSHNGIAGTLPDSLIAPGQGFWVKANASGPSINLTPDIRSSGGQLLKQKPIPQIRFSLSGDEMKSSALISFDESASSGKDPMDAYKLQSLNAEYLSLFSYSEEGTALDINSVPLDSKGVIEIPIDFDAVGSIHELTLRLTWETTLPEEWKIELTDNLTSEAIDLKNKDELLFEVSGAQQKSNSETQSIASPRSQLNGKKSPLERGFRGVSDLVPIVIKTSGKSKLKTAEPRFTLTITSANVVSNEPQDELPETFGLNQNYPNPFNPSTVIKYQLPEKSAVLLEVFDMLGRKVSTLVDQQMNSGYHEVEFDAVNLSSGMYIYRLVVNGNVFTKKLTLIK